MRMRREGGDTGARARVRMRARRSRRGSPPLLRTDACRDEELVLGVDETTSLALASYALSPPACGSSLVWRIPQVRRGVEHGLWLVADGRDTAGIYGRAVG